MDINARAQQLVDTIVNGSTHGRMQIDMAQELADAIEATRRVSMKDAFMAGWLAATEGQFAESGMKAWHQYVSPICVCGHTATAHPLGHSENLVLDGSCSRCDCKNFRRTT